MAYIQFLGAAGTVTGSKHLINTSDNSSGTDGFQVLVDCGLFQGQKEWRERNWRDLPVPPGEAVQRVLAPAHGQVVAHIEAPSIPATVTVNDGSVPESDISNNSFTVTKKP